MILYLKLAWRNLWRNKRRTIIAASSVFFAVLLAIIMRSLQYGSYDFMVDAAVRTYTGYLQIHTEGYWEERNLEKSMHADRALIDSLESIPYVTTVVPRIENVLLISAKEITKVATTICIDPEREQTMTRLQQKLVAGRYLFASDTGVLLAEGLAHLLSVSIGDSVVLYGQGLYGVTAAAVVPVVGIVKFAIPDLNTTFAYIPLAFGQTLFAFEDRLTTISILLSEPKKINDVKRNIETLVGASYEVMTWEEMMPELVQGILLDNVGGAIMLAILYVVIAFGILGTVMMMTVERAKEFGVLIAVGMKKSKLVLVTAFEALFISLLGAGIGLLISVPIVHYFNKHPFVFTGEIAEVSLKFGVEPVIPLSTDIEIFIAQTAVVFAIALCSILYPLLYVHKLNPVSAMRA